MDLKYLIAFVIFSIPFCFYSQSTDDNPFKDAPLTFPIVIHYENVSSEISHVSRLKLAVLAEYLNENPSYSVTIVGHVCCGPAPRLSKKRAKSVYNYLVDIGVSRNQMTYLGKSFDEPIVKVEKTEQDKERNRRVEIEIYTH